MQRPRHRNRAAALLTRRALGRLAACLLLLSLVALSGCRDDSGKENARQAAEYRTLLDASGKRVVIVGADGEQLSKLRKRSDQIKVYDDELKARGYVRWERPKLARVTPPAQADGAPEDAPQGVAVGDDTPDEAPKEDNAPPAQAAASDLNGDPKSEFDVQIKELGAHQALRIRPVEQPDSSPRIVELADQFQIIEQPPAGEAGARPAWKVVSPKEQVLGVFKNTGEDEWQLWTEIIDDSSAEEASDFNAVYRVPDADASTQMKLMQGEKLVATVQFGELSPLELLSLQLKDLSPLARVSVGVWLTKNAL